MNHKEIYICLNDTVEKLKYYYFNAKDKTLKEKIKYEINKYEYLKNKLLKKNIFFMENMFSKLSLDVKLIIFNKNTDKKINAEIIKIFNQNIKKFLGKKESFYLQNFEKSKNNFL